MSEQAWFRESDVRLSDLSRSIAVEMKCLFEYVCLRVCTCVREALRRFSFLLLHHATFTVHGNGYCGL